MFLGAFFSVIISFNNSEKIAYAENTYVTRAEWIHYLVDTFDMEIPEDNLKPDDYFPDIVGNEYYNDIIV